ncbi:MAG: ROK family protein [Verrucomicrobia bacterium]|nr:ROK family protein [Verrucomicrobiota bacterium]
MDIGGTKMAVAAVDRHGTRLAQTTLPTEASLGFDRAVSRLIEAISTVTIQAGGSPDHLRGIGIGCAGPVDPARGLINNPYTLTGWDRCDIVTPLHARFGVPVWLENDADAALLGECFAGAGRDLDPVVLLTFGTGIGGAAMVRGALYRGANGEHPELGHIPVLPDGPACYCGHRGCLESLASGTALADAGRPHGWGGRARGLRGGGWRGGSGADHRGPRPQGCCPGGLDPFSHFPAPETSSGRRHDGGPLRPLCGGDEPAPGPRDPVHPLGRQHRAGPTGQRRRGGRRCGARLGQTTVLTQ